MIQSMVPARLLRGGTIFGIPAAAACLKKTLLLLLIPALTLPAQSLVKITGQINDARTGQPIPHVQVHIEGSTLGTTSDQQGRFSFSDLTLGRYTLRTQHIGYETVRQTVTVLRTESQHCHIALTPSVVIAPAIQVEGKAATHDGHSHKLTHKAIEQSHAQDLGELLETLPQVDVQRSSGPGSPQRVSLRGSNSNQVLILLDGAPINDPATGEADLSNLPLSTIESVEVIKGGASHLYGSGALGGVIKVTTRSARKRLFSVDCSQGSYGLYSIQPAFTTPAGPLKVHISGHYQQVAGDFPFSYLAPGDTGLTNSTRRNSDAREGHCYFKVNWQNNRHQLALSGQAGRSERGLPGKIHVWTPYARVRTTQSRATLQHLWQPRIHVQSALTLVYARTGTDNFNHAPEDAPAADTKLPDYDHSAESKLSQARYSLTLTPFEWLEMLWQISARYQRYEDINHLGAVYKPVGIAEDRSWGSGLTATLRRHLPAGTGIVKWQNSLRYDAFRISSEQLTRHESQWSPGSSLSWTLSGRHSLGLTARWNRSYRLPTLNDLFYQEARVQGRPDLLPEKGRLRELSFNAHLNGTVRARLQASVFRQDIKDMINWRMGFFQIFYPVNTDALITGSEISLELERQGSPFALNASYTQMDALNKDTHHALYDKQLVYRPLWTVKAAGRLELTNWALEWRYQHVGPRYYTESNTSRFDDYSRHDISISRMTNKPFGLWQFTFQCLNLFNSEYELIERMPLPGREYRVHFNFKR